MSARLRAVDDAIDGAGPRLTLAPDREQATRLVVLVERVGAPLGTIARDALAEGLARVARAQLESFPDNLLWDFDYLAASLAGRLDPEAILAAAQHIEALEVLFGQRTAINFRYAHDFLYGFDWARWVAREPAGRGTVGPFDPQFLETLHRRGRELLDLIDRDDEKYPRLPAGVRRNPFPFPREPADELRLHRTLAATGWLPVEAWRADARPIWDRGYTQQREQEARRLAKASGQ